MIQGWHTYLLSELLTIKNGKDHKALAEGKYPVIGSGGIMRYVDSFLYNKPSILLPRKGTLDNIQFCDTPFWTVDTLYYTEVKDSLTHPYYLYWYLRMLDLSKLDSGTGVPSMTFESYYNIKVNLPPLSVQRKIGKLLSDIDRKIALNRRMNATLEAMARQLYDYWFVQFDFPDADGKPYKSSGGKMTWNDKLKREIPEGWEASNIYLVADVLSGGTPSKAKAEYWDNGDIPFFGPVDCNGSMFQIDTADHITQAGLEHCASSLFEEGDIIITARGSIGKLVVVGKPMAMNQSCYAFQSKAETFEYLYFLAIQLIDSLKAKGSGSVFKSITLSDIENSLLCIAKSNLINAFCEKVHPFLQQIKFNTKNTAKLTRLRSTLLPLLMNGQASVND